MNEVVIMLVAFSSRDSMKSYQLYTTIALIITVVIIIIVVRYSYKVNPALEIVYSSIGDFDVDMLKERSPILFREQLVEPVATIRRILKYQYATSRIIPVWPEGGYKKTRARWTLIFANDINEVTLVHPLSGEDVTIAIKPDQALLVPVKWGILSMRVKACEFYDFATLFCSDLP